MKYLTFDKVFKIAILLILVGYLIVLNNRHYVSPDKGRYQVVYLKEGKYIVIFDTQTGTIARPNPLK